MSETSDQSSQPYAEYANYIQIGFNAFEFLIDFGQDYGEGRARIHTRIVTCSTHARSFISALRSSLEEYDKHYAEPEPEA